MSDDYAELKAQIFAAREIIGHLCAEGRPPRMSIPANRYADEDMVMDAALAAADKAIDALRAENERLRSENRLLHLSVAGGDNDLMRLLDKYAADCQAYFDQAEALCAENERLRKDAERWRFMRTNYGRLSADTLTGTLRIHVEPRRWGIVTPEDADAAIDAAMKATGSPESS